MFFSWQHARIVEDWTGLRPVRSKVRLERETIRSGPSVIEVSFYSTTAHCEAR